MKLKPLTLDWLADEMEAGRRYSFSRWGDGEWAAMLGDYGPNADGVNLSEKMGRALREVVGRQRPYLHGMLPVALRVYGEQIEEYWQEQELWRDCWYQGEVLLEGMLTGNLLPLLNQLRQRRVLYVGPQYCRQVKQFLSLSGFVGVHGSEAFDDRARILTSVLMAIGGLDIEVVCYSAGPASNWLIAEIYEVVEGKVWQLDFGSMWDGFFGVSSRSYIKNGGINWEALADVYKY